MPFDGSDQNRVVQAIDRMEAFFDGGRRWIKGSVFDGHGRCLVGAVAVVAMNDRDLRHEVWDCLAAALPPFLRADFTTQCVTSMIPVYNDSCASYAGIEKLLHKAREIAKEKVNAI